MDNINKYDNIDDNKNNVYREPFFGKIISYLGSFFCCCYPYKTVNKGHKGIITKFGRVERVVCDNEPLIYKNKQS